MNQNSFFLLAAWRLCEKKHHAKPQRRKGNLKVNYEHCVFIATLRNNSLKVISPKLYFIFQNNAGNSYKRSDARDAQRIAELKKRLSISVTTDWTGSKLKVYLIWGCTGLLSY